MPRCIRADGRPWRRAACDEAQRAAKTTHFIGDIVLGALVAKYSFGEDKHGPPRISPEESDSAEGSLMAGRTFRSGL